MTTLVPAERLEASMRMSFRRAPAPPSASPSVEVRARPVRVYVVEDHEVIRRAVVEMLEGAEDIEVLGAAASLREARSGLETHEPDVAVLDVRLPDGSGLEFCRELRSARPGLACVMFTSHMDQTAVIAAAIAGAAAYVIKSGGGDPSLLATIRDVAAGENLLRPHAALAQQRLEAVGRISGPLGALTAREDEIRVQLMKGRSNAEIAHTLQISERTLQADLASLLGKTLTLDPPPPERRSRSRA